MLITIYSNNLDKTNYIIKEIEHYEETHSVSIYYSIYSSLDNLVNKKSDLYIFVDDNTCRLIAYLNKINSNNVLFISDRSIIDKNVIKLEDLPKYFDKYNKAVINKDVFIVKSKDAYIKIAYKNITYIELIGKHVYFYLNNKTYVVSNSIRVSFGEFLKDILDDKRFIRCHSAFVVNMDYVSKLSKNNFVLKDNGLVPISNNRLKNVLDVYKTY